MLERGLFGNEVYKIVGHRTKFGGTQQQCLEWPEAFSRYDVLC